MLIEHLKSVVMTSQSLKKNSQETAVFVNQTNYITMYGLGKDETSSFNLAWTDNVKISDFHLVSYNKIITLSYLGCLRIYRYNVVKEESELLSQFKILEGSQISTMPGMDQESNFHMMSFCSMTQVCLIASRMESNLNHQAFFLVKVSDLDNNPRFKFLSKTTEYAFNPKKQYFKVLGNFGMFEGNPIFFGIGFTNQKTRLYSFAFNLKTQDLGDFKDPKEIDLGLCECVCFGEEFYWAIDEHGSTARIGLNYC